MQMSPLRLRITYNGLRPGTPPTLFRKVAVVVAAVLVTGVALLFSVVLLAVLLAVGVVAGGYVWWRTRALRNQLREQVEATLARARATSAPQDQADVIEGEFSRMGRPADELPSHQSHDDAVR